MLDLPKTIYTKMFSKMAAELEDKGENVPLRVNHELDNPIDSKAVTFECHIENEWKVIGYVVQKALDALHKALETEAITEIKFQWIKCIVHWSRMVCWSRND